MKACNTSLPSSRPSLARGAAWNMFRVWKVACAAQGSCVSVRACHTVHARVNMMISCQSGLRHPASWFSAQRPLSCSRAPFCQAANSQRPSPGNDPRLSSTDKTMAPADPNLKVRSPCSSWLRAQRCCSPQAADLLIC